MVSAFGGGGGGRQAHRLGAVERRLRPLINKVPFAEPGRSASGAAVRRIEADALVVADDTAP